jgi:hypothetical protein
MNRNVYATILIILAIGLYFTVTQTVFNDTKKIQASNTEYVNAIESAKRLIAVRDQVLADYNNLTEDDKTRLDKLVPKSVDNIRLIIDLNNVALQHGFSLKGIKAVAASSGSNGAKSPSQNSMPVVNSGMQGANGQLAIATPVLDKVTVSFGVSAPYQQFISFLQDLEASLRIMDVSHLSVTADEKGIYDWKVELQTYWLRSQ